MKISNIFVLFLFILSVSVTGSFAAKKTNDGFLGGFGGGSFGGAGAGGSWGDEAVDKEEKDEIPPIPIVLTDIEIDDELADIPITDLSIEQDDLHIDPMEMTEKSSSQVVKITTKNVAITNQLEEKENKILTIVNKLDSISSKFQSSDWKTETGQFNTARLISDSVAGVVLGTVGGLVTSSIVKKSQTKQGFEDLNCVISGQVVAGYGDEFVIEVK